MFGHGWLLQTLLEIVQAVVTVQSLAATFAVVGALAAVTLTVVVCSRTLAAALLASPPSVFRPLDRAELATLASQSDPDTDARPRPRAPGRILSVA